MPKDPPVGRIGYVFDGGGQGRTLDVAKEVRCNGCRTWFDGLLHDCPGCGRSRPGFSKPIRTAQLNNALYVQAGLRNPG